MKFEDIVRKIAAACGWELHEEPKKIVVDVPTGGGRRQVVAITRDTDIADQEIARYWSVIGKVERVDLTRCLRENARLCHGAFAILDDKLVLMDTQLIATADPTEVAASIGNIAAYADRYERELFGTDTY